MAAPAPAALGCICVLPVLLKGQQKMVISGGGGGGNKPKQNPL